MDELPLFDLCPPLLRISSNIPLSLIEFIVFGLYLIELIGLDFLNGSSSSSCHILVVFLVIESGFKLLNQLSID